MAQRTEYDESQAAKRLQVPVAAFRWARHTELVPPPDASTCQWSRSVVQALDADAIRSALPEPPLSGGAAADRIAEALSTPNTVGEPPHVTVFVVRPFIDRQLLTDLSVNPDSSLLHPGQVADVCRREDLAELVAADTPLGPEQAAARLGVRRTDFDHMLRLGWVRSPQTIEVRFGTSRAGAVDVALYTTASIDALPRTHTEVDWAQLRKVKKGQRSPLASLRSEPDPAPA
ncbi:hypothetical protein [Streptomyces spectabilis]|uniref:Uncharacterized protein n=1 Tax=Streptomyces spectabilis TaxID=68270 RepID=A0A7W8B5N7_STRST|nr:hypothetical protein [Streptomyces spectabilis]MBB5109028.1 hypothetical protein [Streptomyces spectabilis]GGV50747.1 hypothetical protein GCM10010245_80010 [Streptomyces spectabilis]